MCRNHTRPDLALPNRYSRRMAEVVILDQDSEWNGSSTKEEDPLMSAFAEEEYERDLVHLGPGSRTSKGEDKNTGFVVLLTLTSALGGFLFGYDTGVVSGAVLEIRRAFSLDSTWLELIVSVTVASAAIFALVAGFLCDVLGRRPTLLISSIVFTIGAAIMGVSYYPQVLLIGRATVGAGIGMAAMAVPMYIAESAPSDMRGKLIVVNLLFVTGGQFVATVVDGIFSYLRYDIGWRFMLGLAGLPSLMMFVGFLFVPESPRWLVFHGQSMKARRVLQKMRPHDSVNAELFDIRKDYEEFKRSKIGCSSFIRRFCMTRSVLLALLVGCGLQLFQQFSGINTIMYYSASIIQMAGFPDRSAIWLATIPGGANFIFTIVGLLLVDRIGRRKLLLVSSMGAVFSLLLLSATFVCMAYFSPASVPYDSAGCTYSHCGSCIENSGCGFCADVDTTNGSYVHGTCVPSKQLPNGTVVSKFKVGGMICPVVGGQVSKHKLPDGSIEIDILFPLFDDGGGSGVSERPSEQHPLQRMWFTYSCPNNKLAPLPIVAIFLYIAFFAIGMGPLPWTVNSEIYPMWARSTAISIATMVNWVSNLVVSMTFLTMADNLGQPVTFGLFAGFATLGLIFSLLFLPETKGSSLEEVEQLFQRPYFMEWLHRK